MLAYFALLVDGIAGGALVDGIGMTTYSQVNEI
jgi:hypothetical protein